jgi:hypothetical protein
LNAVAEAIPFGAIYITGSHIDESPRTTKEKALGALHTGLQIQTLISIGLVGGGARAAGLS